MGRVVEMRPGARYERTRAASEPPPVEAVEPDLDRFAKRLRVLAHRIERVVAEHPWRALGAVALSGVLIGLAISPRTSKSLRRRIAFGGLTFLGKRLALRALGDLEGEPRL